MFPIQDNIPSRTTPFVNMGIILVCGVVFFLQLQQRDSNGLVEQFGMIPARVFHPDEPVEIIDRVPLRTPLGIVLQEQTRLAAPAMVPPLLTLVTCMFLHGGWMHIIGNLWFLYIFGDNVEDRLGHVGYVVFYFACGVGASAAHLVVSPASPVPTIGASGAIAGVMGAYFVLYPKAQVLAIVPIFFIIQMIVLPAPVFLGIWFLLQFFQGTWSITSAQSAGVAWWAHIGGFAVGVVIALLLKASDMTKPPVAKVRPHTEHAGVYRVYPRRR